MIATNLQTENVSNFYLIFQIIDYQYSNVVYFCIQQKITIVYFCILHL